MTLLKIVGMGHPVLRRIADPVADPGDPEIARLAADMIETMRDAPGIGLAAPQVYRPLRLIVFEVPASRQEEGEPPAPDGPTVLINPEIAPLADDIAVGMEGCLSIPGFRGLVPRWRRIGYRGLGLDGQVIEREAEGLHARVVQHEVDHLDGVLYLDRLRDLTDLAVDAEAHHLADRA
ncbi:peptide deformylase [Inquilinus sp. YAF38]|uniref:peptide deformylase n=1 Tax=Inquilinus sp. YAF38 TaxID=3233084 RepID=UPI003F8F0A9D